MTLRVRILAACGFSLFAGAIQAADLLSVYERALQNDPQIAEPDANRLASRESKPQAVAALLPQFSASGGYSKDEQTIGQTTLINSDPNDSTSPLVPASISRDADGHTKQYDLT